MTRSYFIAGAGTGVGKTLVTTSLCWQLREKITAIKPVVSGYDAHSDTSLILASLGLPVTPENVEKISPWRFTAPLAPSLAAAKEGKRIVLDEVVAFCQKPRVAEIVIAEGAGGVMAPLSENKTILDLMKALEWPAVLVSGSYLGAVSHALTAAESLKNAGIKLQALIVSESEGNAVSLDETASMIKNFMPKTIPVVKLSRLAAKNELWKHAPSLNGILDD